MLDMKSVFLAALDKNGYQYYDVNADRTDCTMVVMPYKLDKPPEHVQYLIAFDGFNSNGVQIHCKLAHFSKDKLLAGIEVCNRLNGRYRWVRFNIDDGGDLMVGLDDTVTKDTVFDQLMLRLAMLNEFIEESYPEFMKALWG